MPKRGTFVSNRLKLKVWADSNLPSLVHYRKVKLEMVKQYFKDVIDNDRNF